MANKQGMGRKERVIVSGKDGREDKRFCAVCSLKEKWLAQMNVYEGMRAPVMVVRIALKNSNFLKRIREI